MRIKIVSNRKTPLQGMTIYPTIMVDLSPENVDQVFWKRLADLTEGIFLRGDEIWQTVGTHPHNGDDIDEKVGHVADERWQLPLAAYRLRKAIMTEAV